MGASARGERSGSFGGIEVLGLLGLALLAGACGDESPRELAQPPVVDLGDTTPPPVDADGDGSFAGDDCDDADPDVYPGAPELCDGKDNDCMHGPEPDADGDGAFACDDCDDADGSRFPGAPDPVDGIDQDCDGTDGVGERADLVWRAGEGMVLAGHAVAVQDLDGDGCDELFVGAPGLSGYIPTTSSVARFAGCGGFAAPDLVREAPGPGIWAGWNVDAGVVDGTPVVMVVERLWSAQDAWGAVRLYPPDYTETSVAELTVFGTDFHLAADAAVLLGDPATRLLVASQSGDTFSVFDLPALGTRTLDTADQVLWTSGAGLAGHQVGDVGDRDGDGLVDLGLAESDTEGSAVYFPLPGPDAFLPDAPEVWSVHETGYVTVGGGGDLTGDGRDDAVIADMGYTDRVSELSVAPWQEGRWSTTADAPARVVGEYAGEFTGWDQEVADVDGDGAVDLLIGASGSDFARGAPGKVMLFLGPLQGVLTRGDAARVWVGDERNGAAGYAVAAGDLDGSGGVDVVFGAPDATGDPDVPGSGAVHLVFDPF